MFCSPWPLSNQGIKYDDNFTVVLNILNNWKNGQRVTATFDEYHHGYGVGQGIMSLIGRPAKAGLGQIAAAFLLLMFAVSRRFGRPIPLMEGARHRSEYLSSMSALLRKAHATRLLRKELGRKFLQDSAMALGLAPTAEPEAIIEATTRRHPEKAGTMQELVRAAIPMPGEEINEDALLKLAHQWYQMRKDLTKRP